MLCWGYIFLQYHGYRISSFCFTYSSLITMSWEQSLKKKLGKDILVEEEEEEMVTDKKNTASTKHSLKILLGRWSHDKAKPLKAYLFTWKWHTGFGINVFCTLFTHVLNHFQKLWVNKSSWTFSPLNSTAHICECKWIHTLMLSFKGKTKWTTCSFIFLQSKACTDTGKQNCTWQPWTPAVCGSYSCLAWELTKACQQECKKLWFLEQKHCRQLTLDLTLHTPTYTGVEFDCSVLLQCADYRKPCVVYFSIRERKHL